MMAAEGDRLQRNPLAGVQRADTLGGAELMSADGVKVDSEFANVDRNSSRHLDPVRVEHGSTGARHLRDLADRLKSSGLIVRVHDRDQYGRWAQRALQLAQKNDSIAAD